jgi:RHS repeat-associated protein
MTSGPKPGAETTRIHMKYDAWNRMVEVRADDGNGQPGAIIQTNRYDGLARRIHKIVAGSPDVTYDYYYNEARQVLEVRKDGGTNPLEQYVWDIRYVHSPVMRWRDGNTDGDLDGGSEEGDSTLYYCNDANFNVTALVDTSGNVVERVVYDPYGKPTFYDGSWANPSSASACSNAVLYTGHRLDAETGLCYGGARYYHPTLGRWTTQDMEGYLEGCDLYESCRSSPAIHADPYGKAAISTVVGQTAVADMIASLRTSATAEHQQIQEAKARGDSSGAAEHRRNFKDLRAQMRELESLSKRPCDKQGEISGEAVQVGFVPGALSPGENGFAQAFAAGAAIATEIPTSADDVLASGAKAVLGVPGGFEAAAEITKNYETLVGGSPQIHGVWIELQCMECKCAESKHFKTLNWVDTKKVTVPCDVSQTSWGKANPVGIGKGLQPDRAVGYMVPYALLGDMDKSQIREQCAEQGKEKAKENCK